MTAHTKCHLHNDEKQDAEILNYNNYRIICTCLEIRCGMHTWKRRNEANKNDRIIYFKLKRQIFQWKNDTEMCTSVPRMYMY